MIIDKFRTSSRTNQKRAAIILVGMLLVSTSSRCSTLPESDAGLPENPTNVTAEARAATELPHRIPATASLDPPLEASVTPTTSPTPFERTPLVIGHSVAGRPLEVYRFGHGEKHRMIIAGIHGGYEGNTIRLADQLIQVIRARPELVPDEFTLYILRSLNPDGEARSSSYKGRVNENLVDLNRNWPSHWQKTWPLEGCWTYTYVTGGSHPASEPETRALMNFLLTYRIEALINYHSAALGIFPGGQPPDPGSVSLAEAIAAVSNYPYPPIETGCQYTGQLIDWASDQGIPAVDIELTNHTDTDLIQNLRVLTAFLAWSVPLSAATNP
jgi:predicted deacylase